MRIYLRAFGYHTPEEVPCEICGGQAVDIHHIKPRSTGGKDVIENLMGLCRQHHSDCDAFRISRDEQRRIHETIMKQIAI